MQLISLCGCNCSKNIGKIEYMENGNIIGNIRMGTR